MLREDLSFEFLKIEVRQALREEEYSLLEMQIKLSTIDNRGADHESIAKRRSIV